MNPEEREQAEFNMSVSYLNRLNYWFYMADDAASKLDGYAWFHSLVVLFRELSTEMKEKEIDEWNDKIFSINTDVINNQAFCNRTKKNSVTPKLYKALHFFEMFIRKVLKESGLQVKMKDKFDISGL